MCGDCEIIPPLNEASAEPLAMLNGLTEAKLDLMVKAIGQLPQVDLGTEHFFHNGVYTRTGKIPAGTLIIGRKHKARSVFHISKGKIVVWDCWHGVRTLTAPFSEITQPGTQRVGYALADVEGCNILETACVTVQAVEAEMLFPYLPAIELTYENLPEPKLEAPPV